MNILNGFCLPLITFAIATSSAQAATATAAPWGTTPRPGLPQARQQATRQILPLTRTMPMRPGRPAAFQVIVPRGVNQVVMEQRQGAGWKPIQVFYPQFASNESSKAMPINPPSGVALTQIRLVAYRGNRFPGAFMTGPSDYERTETAINDLRQVATFGPVLIRDTSLMWQTQTLALTASQTDANTIAPAGTATPAPASNAAIDAVESDIWQISGNQLFFFNQHRGLQVFDMTNPMAPVRTGGVRLPASGEQMFVLNAEAGILALLGRTGPTRGALFVMQVRRGVPAVLAELPVEGQVIDSRLSGTRLFFLMRGDPAALSLGEHHIRLLTVDLANPAAPAVKASLDLGSSTVSYLQADGGHLLVSAQSITGATVMHVIGEDLSHGVPMLLKSVPLKGRIQDKFKMGIVGGAAVAVTSVRGLQPQGLFLVRPVSLQTWVETFPIAGDATAPLAQLELVAARDETLHGTRFDGSRLYVVTLLVRTVTDPLFVIDLADPAKPEVLGSVEIPGWSTFLQPQGDRIVAVGIEGAQVAASLFDVANPRAPQLMSRLLLGSSRSTSEATADERAVEFYPEASLMMIPVRTWELGGWKEMMQVVDIGRSALALGTAIEHEDQARRGAVMGEHLISISAREMRVLSRRTGKLETVLPLAWRVDRVFVHGKHVVQLTDAAEMSADGRSSLRVSPQHDPDAVVAQIDLGADRIIGADLKGNRLHVVQWIRDRPRLVTSLFDLTSPAKPRKAAAVAHLLAPEDTAELDMGDAQALWVNQETLVWSISGRRPWSIPQVSTMPVFTIGRLDLTPATAPGGILTLSSSGVTSSVAAPIQVPPPVKPATAALLCPINSTSNHAVAGPVLRVTSPGSPISVGKAFTAGGFVFTSYDCRIEPAMTAFAWTSSWKLRSWLAVVDFNAPTPVVRDAASIPGPLLSVANADLQGATLLTAVRPDGGAGHLVHASAYDGVKAYLLDSINITGTVPGSAAAADGGQLFFMGYGETGSVAGVSWDAQQGRLRPTGRWLTTGHPAALAIAGDHLLAISGGLIEAAAIKADGSLIPGAVFDTPPNLWLRVERTQSTAAGLWIPAGDYGVEFLPRQDLAR